MIIPSSSECGSPSRTDLSMNAPGSPSSALHTRYFSFPGLCFAAFHLNQVGKPAPPLPLSPDIFISSITSSGVIEESTFSIALYPSAATYSSISSGFITPQFLRTTLCCLPTNCLSSSEIAYSSATLWLTRCSSTIFSTFSGCTLTYLVISPLSSYMSTIGSR